MSYEAVKETLAAIKTSSESDSNTKSSATNLHDKMESADFVISIMFMKNIMTKTKQMTEALQAENLNIVDAMAIITATVESLKRINENEKAMDDEIQAGIVFAKKLGGNPEAEFSRKHRVRRPPRRIDDNPNTQTELSICQYYLREFKKVLDVQIVQFGDNLAQCLQAVKPLATVLQPPLKQPNLADISDIVDLFPSNMTIDAVVLQAEFENFVSYVDQTKTKFESLAEAAKFSEDCKSAFPLTNKAFRLIMTAPVTVAKDERTFSRLKIIKTYLRTIMTDTRLESLMLLSCEKDLTDSINIDNISARWVELKSRRISAH
jgi:D-ribose pyranose/furanose isomerase RbsD